MTLKPGVHIGPYDIVDLLGEGGMGVVYRARDAKLNRDVALKVLPDTLAGDPDRLERFQREAQVLAALNHPNIAHIYGLEGHAIVMELVEGPTLSELLADQRRSAPAAAAPSESASRGAAASGGGAPRALENDGPLPLGDVLSIARQIAEALESASRAWQPAGLARGRQAPRVLRGAPVAPGFLYYQHATTGADIWVMTIK